MSGERALIRPGRLAAAWLLCIVCGCAGAAAWMPLYRWLEPALSALPPMAAWLHAAVAQVALYGTLFAFIGAGIYCGVRISRGFLNPVELEVLFRLPRNDSQP